ncbi:tripartite tricarboxylate transporter TctB family protein [Propylenella binzhouense]|uniref:Tripartite tricarboxylate transporter TctB family protein n=1 Tax=Propylenella binzhouense TaxID=2555902 RepID=A0A964T665_9HYPH|nr:tripartite tricarboxylate transporter TctB family protein [Propylenella binzhouense]MYZ48632.1 tripartite tricarboxylate transporter TctB family protein [Propylenella binzhouense]
MSRDFYVGLVILAGAALYWTAAGRIPISFLDGVVTASTMPRTLALVLGMLALALMGQSVAARLRNSPAAPAEDGERPTWRQHGRALGMLAIGIGFLAALPVLGYALSVGLLLAVAAFFNGRQRPLPLLAFGLLGAILFYALFVLVLRVPMPGGVWPELPG